MRIVPGVLALAALAVLCAAGSQAGAATFSDQLCAEASQSVNAFAQLSPSDGKDPQKVYDAAHAVTSTYDVCQRRHLANGEVEPGVHYAYVREASFGIVEARALLALGRPSDAKAVAQNSKRIAQDVVDWRRSVSQNGSIIGSSGNDTRPSVYRDSAKEIIAAADDLLAKLNAPPAAPAGPAFTPAPRSSPSP